MRLWPIALCALLLAGPAHSATISIVNGSDNTVCSGISGGTCSGDSGVFGTDFGAAWDSTASGGGTATLGSTAQAFISANGVVAIDGGGDGTKNLNFNRNFTLNITAGGSESWRVDLNASILGLHAQRGDGAASAVGNQQDGSTSISTVTTTVNGSNYNIGGSSRSVDCANSCESSAQFSNSLATTTVLTGTGNASVGITLDFDLSAFTNDGCNGSICSSASGGEESGTLFGRQSVIDQAVDEYSTWGRSIGPDGYNGTFTLTVVPEPSTALLLVGGLGGLALFGSRQKRS